MSLTDGDVAALARQAVDEVDPTVDIAIEPADPVDPYRRDLRAWLVHPLFGGRRSFAIYLDSRIEQTEALEQLREEIGRHRPEQA